MGAVYFAFGFYPAVSTPQGDVVNLSLQQDRLLGFLASLVAFLSGLFLMIFAHLYELIERGNEQARQNPASDQTMAAELAKRAPVDEVRLHSIVQNSKAGLLPK